MRTDDNMKEQIMLLGLPLKTWIVVGGLYFMSAFLPAIIMLILEHRKGEEK